MCFYKLPPPGNGVVDLTQGQTTIDHFFTRDKPIGAEICSQNNKNHHSGNQLSFLQWNCCSFTDVKYTELKYLLSAKNPDIIALSETLRLRKLDGYNVVQHSYVSRQFTLYVKKHIAWTKVQVIKREREGAIVQSMQVGTTAIVHIYFHPKASNVVRRDTVTDIFNSTASSKLDCVIIGDLNDAFNSFQASIQNKFPQ